MRLTDSAILAHGWMWMSRSLIEITIAAATNVSLVDAAREEMWEKCSGKVFRKHVVMKEWLLSWKQT